MAKPITFRSLIQAIAGAITSAQSEIERQHLLNLGSFFDKDRRPLTLSARLPRLRRDQVVPDEETVEVPLLTLVPLASLRIAKADVEFDVDLTGFEAEEATPQASAVSSLNQADGAPAMPKVRRILIDAFNLGSTGSGPRAHVKLQVREAEMPEGVARILTELNKYNGRPNGMPNTPPTGPEEPAS